LDLNKTLVPILKLLSRSILRASQVFLLPEIVEEANRKSVNMPVPSFTERSLQRLIVWGIHEGRGAAVDVDEYLMKNTRLPWAGSIKKRDFTLIPMQNKQVSIQA
jgi:hypothetical protein